MIASSAIAKGESRPLRRICIASLFLVCCNASLAQCAELGGHSITDRSVQWPSAAQWKRTILLQDYNTRVVVFGTALLGLASGLVGSFTLLRRRALMGDALAHATLPGIGTAFIVATQLGWNGKSLPILLLGGIVSGLIGLAAIFIIRRTTKLKDDVAMGVVLSVFFGLGMAILGLVQQMQSGHAAGLESFIYGKTASMIASDAWLIGTSGAVCILLSCLFFKELKLLCFDENFGASRGYSMVFLDSLLMALVVVVSIVGLQAVGLILMIALLVIPPASARFWTDEMQSLAIYSAFLGSVSCALGATASALFPRLPSGAMIVLVASAIFVFSVVFGSRRGMLILWTRRWQLNARIDRQHLLRGLFELTEVSASIKSMVSWRELLVLRSWTPHRLKSAIAVADRAGLIRQMDTTSFALTEAGAIEASRLVREHRLWEIYLITHAETAPSRVDRDADAIEHVLEPVLIAELERALAGRLVLGTTVPPDPHASLEKSLSTTAHTATTESHSNQGLSSNIQETR